MNNKIFNALVSYYQSIEREVELDNERKRLRFAVGSPHGRIRVMLIGDDTRNTVQLHAFSPVYVPANKYDTVMRFLTYVNYQTHYGGFELDMRDGELSFCIYLLLDDDALPSHYQLETIERVSVLVLHNYLPGIYGIIYGDMDYETAVRRCEREEAPAAPPPDQVHRPNSGTDVTVFPPFADELTDESAPITEEAYIRRAQIKLFEHDDFQGSIEDFTKAIEINPGSAAAYTGRAIAREAILDHYGALLDYNKALKIKEDVSTYNNRAMLFVELGMYDEAFVDFSRIIEMHPEEEEGFYFAERADVRRLMGDLKGAQDDINKAVEISPNNGYVFVKRGLIKSATGDAAGAMVDFDQAVRLNPNLANIYYERALFKLNVLKNPSEALADLNQTLLLYPRHAKALYERGIIKLTYLNDRDGARRDLEGAARRGLARAIAKLSHLED